MLHIVLLVLKIIGIILAILLGLLILATCAIFFLPLRYQVHALAEGDVQSIQAEGHFSWLLHLISGSFFYYDGTFSGKVKVLWREIKPKEKKEEKAKRKEKRTFRENIKYTFQKICDMIKTCKKRKETLTEFLAEEAHLTAWKCLKKEVAKLIRYIKPYFFRANVHYGTEDPALTGKILAGLSMLYPFYGDNIQIEPDFQEKILEGDALLKGKLRGVRVVVLAWNLFFEESIRKTIRDIQKWKG